MPRPRRAQPQSLAHQFDLRPKIQRTSTQHILNVSFATQKKHFSKNKKQAQKCQNMPVFNSDGNFATPAFILGCDIESYRARGNQMRLEHQCRFANYCQELSQLNIPKPRSKNNYCAVCRSGYQDYLEHIQSSAHKTKISRSNFQKYIQELSKVYHTENNEQKSIKSKQETCISIDQDQVEIDLIENLQQPKKRIKNQEDIILTVASTKSLAIPSSIPYAQYHNAAMNWNPFNNFMCNYPTIYPSLMGLNQNFSLPYTLAYNRYPFFQNNAHLEPAVNLPKTNNKKQPIVIVIDQ